MLLYLPPLDNLPRVKIADFTLRLPTKFLSQVLELINQLFNNDGRSCQFNFFQVPTKTKRSFMILNG